MHVLRTLDAWFCCRWSLSLGTSHSWHSSATAGSASQILSNFISCAAGWGGDSARCTLHHTRPCSFVYRNVTRTDSVCWFLFGQHEMPLLFNRPVPAAAVAAAAWHLQSGLLEFEHAWSPRVKLDDLVDCTVIKITRGAAHVRVVDPQDRRRGGGRLGLIKLRDMSHTFLQSPVQVFEVGDAVKALVLGEAQPRDAAATILLSTKRLERRATAWWMTPRKCTLLRQRCTSSGGSTSGIAGRAKRATLTCKNGARISLARCL